MTGYFRCRPTPALSSSLDHEPIWYTEWSSNNSIRASQMHSRTRRGHVANTRPRTQRPVSSVIIPPKYESYSYYNYIALSIHVNDEISARRFWRQPFQQTNERQFNSQRPFRQRQSLFIIKETIIQFLSSFFMIFFRFRLPEYFFTHFSEIFSKNEKN